MAPHIVSCAQYLVNEDKLRRAKPAGVSRLRKFLGLDRGATIARIATACVYANAEDRARR
jgi:hypothetical protein